MIRLTRSLPACNMHRFYVVHVAPSMFGNWTVVAEWGRIGSPGTVRRRSFATRAEAEAALDQLLRRKRARGYRAVP